MLRFQIAIPIYVGDTMTEEAKVEEKKPVAAPKKATKKAKKLEKNYFVVLDDKNKDTAHCFSCVSPGHAARKAISKIAKDNNIPAGKEFEIRIREKGKINADKTRSVHVFKASYKFVDADTARTPWLKGKLRVGKAVKEKVERITDLTLC